MSLQDHYKQDLKDGDEVIVRCRVAGTNGTTLFLDTIIPTPAYPKGSRINLCASQVEKLEQEDETEKEPLQPNGQEPPPDVDQSKEADPVKAPKGNKRK